MSESKVTCPLCGNDYKSITINHLRKKHGIGSLSEFLEKFPGFELESADLRKRRSETSKEVGQRDEVRKARSENTSRMHRDGILNTSETSKANWETNREFMIGRQLEAQKREDVREKKSRASKKRFEDGYRIETKDEPLRREKISKASKERWNKERDKIVERQREAQKRPEVIQRKSELMTERRKDEGFNKLHRDRMLECWSNPDWVYQLRVRQCSTTYQRRDGTLLNLRSSYELRLCEMLDYLQIEFRYEKYSFPYMFEGEEHRYLVDFYLPEFDLYIEVKPETLITDKALAKYKAVEMSGKRIVFITEKGLNSVDELVKMIYLNDYPKAE